MDPRQRTSCIAMLVLLGVLLILLAWSVSGGPLRTPSAQTDVVEPDER